MIYVSHMKKSNVIAVSEPGSVKPGVLLFLWQSTCGCTNPSPACAVLQAPAGHSQHQRWWSTRVPKRELQGGAGSSALGHGEELKGLLKVLLPFAVSCLTGAGRARQGKMQMRGYCCFL